MKKGIHRAGLIATVIVICLVMTHVAFAYRVPQESAGRVWVESGSLTGTFADIRYHDGKYVRAIGDGWLVKDYFLYIKYYDAPPGAKSITIEIPERIGAATMFVYYTDGTKHSSTLVLLAGSQTFSLDASKTVSYFRVNGLGMAWGSASIEVDYIGFTM